MKDSAPEHGDAAVTRSAPTSRLAAVAAAVVVTAVVAIGLVWRFHGLQHQVVAGDEWHAVVVASVKSFWGVFSEHELEDHAVTYSLYAKALMETVGLDELKLRLPVVIAGILLLLSPLLFRRRIGGASAVVATVLLAVSPLLIYYTYVARTYAIAALLCLLALYAWERSITTPHRRWTAMLVIASVLAIFFHLSCFFALSGLFIVGLLRGVLLRSSLRPWLTAVIGCAIGLTLLVGPGLPELLAVTRERAGEGTPHRWSSVSVRKAICPRRTRGVPATTSYDAGVGTAEPGRVEPGCFKSCGDQSPPAQ